jgi:hypothetical protein
MCQHIIIHLIFTAIVCMQLIYFVLNHKYLNFQPINALIEQLISFANNKNWVAYNLAEN